MPVLTKINTNSIAEDAITGDKFAGDAYLANTANQNISGTYSENRLYTSDAYTLSGNATVNSHLTLSSVKPTADVVLTAGGAYTITGTGVLSGGSLLAKERTDLTGMTGTMGSGVTGSPNLNLTTGLANSNTQFPAGHPIQVKGDTYAPTGAITISTSSTRAISDNLQVEITCASTSNYLKIDCFIPCFINDNVSGRSLKAGFRYSTDNWSSETKLGEKDYIMNHHGYHGASHWVEQNTTWHTWVQVPTTSAMKIQTYTTANNGDVRIFGNIDDSQGVGTLIVTEVQG